LTPSSSTTGNKEADAAAFGRFFSELAPSSHPPPLRAQLAQVLRTADEA
jgi:hypothetical protein